MYKRPQYANVMSLVLPTRCNQIIAMPTKFLHQEWSLVLGWGGTLVYSIDLSFIAWDIDNKLVASCQKLSIYQEIGLYTVQLPKSKIHKAAVHTETWKETQGSNHSLIISYQRIWNDHPWWWHIVSFRIITVIDCGWKNLYESIQHANIKDYHFIVNW